MANKPRTVTEHKLFDRHENHENHLCALVSHRMMNRVADLSKNARYVCHICGRAAYEAENLCEPVEI